MLAARRCSLTLLCAFSFAVCACRSEDTAPPPPHYVGHGPDSDDDGEAGREGTDGGRRDGGGDGDSADGGGRDGGGDDPIDPLPGSGIGTSIFDPDSMYLLGTLESGSAGREVICKPETDAFSGGFESSPLFSLVIHPMTGHLLYLDDSVSAAYRIRRFVADRIRRIEGKMFEYPLEPQENDPEVPTPGCDDRGPSTFLLHPRTGSVYYLCAGDAWFDGDDEPWAACDNGEYPKAISNDGSALCDYWVIDASGTHHILTDMSAWTAVRARPEGGFWAVASGGNERFERSVIHEDGTVELEGTYAPDPDGYEGTGLNRSSTAIDAQGALYRMGGPDSEASDDVVIRYDQDFSSAEVIYSEESGPDCELHSGHFVTGP